MPKIYDLYLNKPTKKTELNKDSMMKYINEHATVEETEWFIELCANNRENKVNNLSGETINGYNIKAIREEFAKKFFPDISEKGKLAKKKANKSKKPTFEDNLEALKAKIKENK